jgi:hypothetical protein
MISSVSVITEIIDQLHRGAIIVPTDDVDRWTSLAHIGGKVALLWGW